MLRLVHPASAGQAPARPRKGLRSPALSLTADEARHFRISLKNLARAYGTWACLADAMGVPRKTLEQAIDRRRRPSGTLVIRAAQAGGMAVEAVLSGALTAAGRCSACGSRIGGAS